MGRRAPRTRSSGDSFVPNRRLEHDAMPASI